MSTEKSTSPQSTPVINTRVNPSVKGFVEERQLESLLKAKVDMLMQGQKIGCMGCWEYLINEKELTWSEGMYKLYDIDITQAVTPEFYNDFAVYTDQKTISTVIHNITRDFLPFEEVVTMSQNGKQRTIWIKADVVRGDNQKPVKMIGADIDISGTINSYDQVQSLNHMLITKNRELESRNSELKTFNNVAANDYNDTLRNLYTCLEFIVTNDARNLSNASRANIRRAQTAIQKMKLMTNDIVNYSRLHTLETDISLVDLQAVLKSELKNLSDKINEGEANITVGELPVIQGFPLLLSLLFHHLLVNALKLRSPDRKLEISIMCEIIEGRLINHPDALMDTRYYVLTFRDNGIGFEHLHAEVIFQMFYRLPSTNKYKGSGIGLAICKKIMALHEGFIIAMGEPNVGATFTCYFPIQH